MDREELMTILPHRDGMLLLDRVEREDDVAHGFFRIPEDAWFLKGHFPGNPIVPGVMLCEILAQSVCVLLQSEMTDDRHAHVYRAEQRPLPRPGPTGRYV